VGLAAASFERVGRNLPLRVALGGFGRGRRETAFYARQEPQPLAGTRLHGLAGKIEIALRIGAVICGPGDALFVEDA
jgi:hypothetical protein